MPTTSTIAPAEALLLNELLSPATPGVASRILSKTGGGCLTLFAFGAGQGLPEHTVSFEALVVVLDGRLAVTIGDAAVTAMPGTVVRLPAGVPHKVTATEPCRVLLVILREPGVA